MTQIFEDVRRYEGFPYVSFLQQNIRDELSKKQLPESRINQITAWVKVTSGVKSLNNPEFISMVGIIKNKNENQSSFVFNNVYDESDSYRFRPGITGIDIKYKGSRGGTRIAQIQWQINSKQQLNQYAPYFLNPGRSVLIEWGWLQDGDLFTLNDSDLYDLDVYKHNQWLLFYERSLKSNGNYDGCFGIVSNFDITLRSDGGFNCTTDVINEGALMYGLQLVQQVELKPKISSGGIEQKYKRTIKQFVENDLEEIVTSGQYSNSNNSLSRDIHVYIDSGESKNNITTRTPGPTGVTNITSTIGNIKKFVTWGFIEDIIVNSHLGAKFSNEDGQIFRLSSKESAPKISSKNNEILSKGFSREINNKRFSSFLDKERNSYKISNNEFLRSTNLSVCYINNGQKANEKYGIRFNESTNNPDNSDKSAGYIRHIYVDLEVVKRAFKDNDKLVDALMSILNQINSACINFWNFKLKIKEPTQEMCVIDDNYFDPKLLEIIDGESDKLYTFKMYGGEGIIKNINFITKLPESVTMTSLYGLNKESDDPVQLNTDNDSIINIWNEESYVDFFIKTTKYELPNTPGLAKASSNEDSNTNQTQNENDKDQLFTSEDNSGFNDDFKITMLPRLEWKKEVNENDLINAMKKKIYSSPEKNNSKYEFVIPADLDFDIKGISGLKIGDVFNLEMVPDFYNKNSVFQISGIDHSVQSNYWTTKIRAILRVFDKSVGQIKYKQQSSQTAKDLANLNNSRWNGQPQKNILKWIKDNMGDIIVSQLLLTRSFDSYPESILAGILYAEYGVFIDLDKDAKTNCEVRNPDGNGTAHSFWQINDVANKPGWIYDRIIAGEWKSPVPATKLAIDILNEKRNSLIKVGISGNELLMGTVAAYNIGQGRIIDLYKFGKPVDSWNREYVDQVFKVSQEYERI